MTPEEIIDRWHDPKFKAGSDRVLYSMGEAHNHVCGDVCYMYVKVKDNVITDARHQTDGCTICGVSADLLCENIIGKTIDSEINLFALLGIPIGINRRQCVVTPLKALREAI